MKKIIAAISLTGLLAWLGIGKIREVKKLQEISFGAGSPPLALQALSQDVASFFINLVVTNPSPVTIKLDELIIEMWYKGSYIGTMQKTDVAIQAKRHNNLSLPVQIVNSKMLPFAKDFLTVGKIPVRFVVAAKLNVWGATHTVPYEYTMDVKEALRDYLRESRPLLAKLL